MGRKSDSALVQEGVPAGQVSGYRKILRDVAEASCNGHGEETLAIFNRIFVAQEFPYRIAISADGRIRLEDNVLAEGASWVACREPQPASRACTDGGRAGLTPVPAGQLEEISRRDSLDTSRGISAHSSSGLQRKG